MIVPSLVTTRTGRLIGIIWLVGSTSDRCSDPALRAAPISLKLGATRDPVTPMRWQPVQAPLPSKTARPRAASPIFTAAVSKAFMLRR